MQSVCYTKSTVHAASDTPSDLGVGSSKVEGKLGLEEEETLIGVGSGDLVKRELLMLSLPAILGQAIDPLAQLMETAYIGNLGSVELASAGISMNIFNYISKTFNIPLLSVATSFVVEDLAKSEKNGYLDSNTNGKPKPVDGVVERKQLSSVSTALLLAVGIGIFEAVALSLGSGLFLNMMGISSIGLFTGISLSVILGVSFGSLATFASQPLNALAYVFDGLHYGVSDFAYAARSMMVVGAVSSAFLLYAPSIFGLHGVWLGLTLFMGLRALLLLGCISLGLDFTKFTPSVVDPPKSPTLDNEACRWALQPLEAALEAGAKFLATQMDFENPMIMAIIAKCEFEQTSF
ncbi:unnamed protein product [Malus baccata var. baccata]